MESCENCSSVLRDSEVKWDCEGVPLCAACMEATIRDNIRLEEEMAARESAQESR